MAQRRQVIKRHGKKSAVILLVSSALVVAGLVWAIVLYPVLQQLDRPPDATARGILQPDVAVSTTGTCQTAAESSNPVAAENTCLGTSSWRVDRPSGSQDAIEGFASPTSVGPDQIVKFYVNTTATSYMFQIYRMGWYQGLGGREMYSSPSIGGIVQPAPLFDKVTRMVSCTNWHDPAVLRVPTSWVSGIYLVKFITSDNFMRYLFFTVHAIHPNAQIVMQLPELTYQAYNYWGRHSLYQGQNSHKQWLHSLRSLIVSFDRPYIDNFGLGTFPTWDYNLIRWMERGGFNLTYISDVDLDSNGLGAQHPRLLIVMGHSEYWSSAMRTRATAARDSGVSLAYFGANDDYWHVRLQSSAFGEDREVACFREDYKRDPVYVNDPTPQNATDEWRGSPLSDPEDSLMGSMFAGIASRSAAMVLTSGAQPFFSGTSLHVGDALGGLVGGEFDHVFPDRGSPSNVSIIASSPVPCEPTVSCNGQNGTRIGNAEATIYTASSGAKVFDAGTFQWSWGLDNDLMVPHQQAHKYSNAAFQRLTANLLAYLVATSAK